MGNDQSLSTDTDTSSSKTIVKRRHSFSTFETYTYKGMVKRINMSERHIKCYKCDSLIYGNRCCKKDNIQTIYDLFIAKKCSHCGEVLCFVDCDCDTEICEKCNRFLK